MVMTIALPGLSAARDDRVALSQFARRASHWIAAVGLPACAACAALAAPIIHVLYGPGYAQADHLLRILALAAALSLVSNVVGTLQITLGIVRPQLIVNTLALTINIAGNFILVPRYGVTSSAWLTVACEALVVTSALIVLAPHVDLREIAAGAGAPLLAVGVAAACSLLFTRHEAIATAVFLVVVVDLFYFFDLWPHELRPSSVRRQKL
jgi:O-antigen/teichoic acid export membrane protein